MLKYVQSIVTCQLLKRLRTNNVIKFLRSSSIISSVKDKIIIVPIREQRNRLLQQTSEFFENNNPISLYV